MSGSSNNRTDFVFQVDVLKGCEESNMTDCTGTTGYHCAAADITPTPFHVVPYQYRVNDPSTIPALEHTLLRKVAEGLGLTACNNVDRVRSIVTGVSLEPRDSVVEEELCEDASAGCSVLVKGGMTIFLDSDAYKESSVNDFFWAVLQETLASTSSSSSSEGSGMTLLVENLVLVSSGDEDGDASREVSSPSETVGGIDFESSTANNGVSSTTATFEDGIIDISTGNHGIVPWEPSSSGSATSTTVVTGDGNGNGSSSSSTGEEASSTSSTNANPNTSLPVTSGDSSSTNTGRETATQSTSSNVAGSSNGVGSNNGGGTTAWSPITEATGGEGTNVGAGTSGGSSSTIGGGSNGGAGDFGDNSINGGGASTNPLNDGNAAAGSSNVNPWPSPGAMTDPSSALDPNTEEAAALDSSASGGPPLAAILGGTLGGVGLLFCLCCCCCCYFWRRRRRNPDTSLVLSPQSSNVSGARAVGDPWQEPTEADGNGQLASLDSLAAKDRGSIFMAEQTEEDTTSGGDEEEGIYITEEESFEEVVAPPKENADPSTGYISGGGYDSDIHFDSDVEGLRVATVDVDDLMTSDDGGFTTDDDAGAMTDDSAPQGSRRRGILQALDETSTNTSSYDEEIMGVLGHVPSPSADSEDNFTTDMDRSTESPRTDLQMT